METVAVLEVATEAVAVLEVAMEAVGVLEAVVDLAVDTEAAAVLAVDMEAAAVLAEVVAILEVVDTEDMVVTEVTAAEVTVDHNLLLVQPLAPVPVVEDMADIKEDTGKKWFN